MTVPDKPWKVLVDDNFDHHETSETPVADFDTRKEAIAYCRARVDRWLAVTHEPGMTAAALFDSYTTFGEDPWILGGKLNDPVPFRAWDYAEDWSAHPLRELHPFIPLRYGKEITQEEFLRMMKAIHALTT